MIEFDYVATSAVSIPARFAGGPFATCFKFGDEPFKLYNNLVLEVLTVSGIIADVGRSSVLVENDPKIFHIE